MKMRVSHTDKYFFFWPRFDGTDLTNMWFHQDSATFHVINWSKSQTNSTLKANIKRVISEIGQFLCDNVIEHWVSRTHHTQLTRGRNLVDIIFKHNLV